MKPAVCAACVAVLALLLARPSSVTVKFAPTGEARSIEGWIADELARAEQEIRVAVYHLSSPRLAEALIAARKKGRKVRILVDAEQVRSSRSTDLWEKFKAAGVEVRRVTPKDLTPDDEEKPRFHHKYCVIDGKRLFTGSLNWSVQADRENHENVVLIEDADVAKSFAQAFDTVWSDASIAQE